MKLHLPKSLFAAVLATFVAEQAAWGADQWNKPTFGGPVYTWTGEGDGSNYTNSENWKEGSAPGRSSSQGPVLVFDNVSATVNGGTGVDTSDFGGIKVTGNSNVSCSVGRWAGAIYVEEGSVLTTSYSQQLKDDYADASIANVYVGGTLSITNSGVLDLADGNSSQNWLIDTNGQINLNNVSSVTKKDGQSWNIQLIHSPDNEAVIEGLTNREQSANATQTRYYMTTGNSDFFSTLDSVTVLDTNGKTLTQGEDYTITNTVGKGFGISYQVMGYETLDLTWNGGAGAVWEEKGATWVNSEGTATSFLNDDNVTFDAISGEVSSTVTINGAVTAGSVQVNDDYTFQTAADSSLYSTGISIAEGKTLTKSGSSTLNISSDVNGSLHISEGAMDISGTVTGAVSIADNAKFSLSNQRNVEGVKVTGSSLYLNMATNGESDGDSRVNLAEGSVVGSIYATGVVAYNRLNQGVESNLRGADLRLSNNGVLLLRTGLSGNIDANIGDIYFDGATGTIRAYASITNASISNDITAAGTLQKTDGGVISLSGNVTADRVLSKGGTLGLSGNVTSNSIMAGGGNITIDGTVTASQLRLKEQGNGTVTVSTGGVLNITGTNNGYSTSASLLMAHWGTGYGTNNTGLIIDGGELNATGAVLKTGWSSSGHFKVLSGTANLKGICFWGQSDQMFGEVVLGSADGDGTARLNIGEGGIINYAGDATLQLGNGVLGATADWSLAHNPAFTAAVINLNGAGSGTVVDTTDANDKETARHITFKNALTGSGKLVVDGVGSLTLCVAGDNTGAVTINSGATLKLQTAGNYTLGSAVDGRGVLQVESGTTLLSNSKSIASDIVLNGGNATLEGDRTISGNITINSGSTLTAGGGDVLQYDAVEALPASSRTITINAGGELAMGENRWSFGRGSETAGGDDGIYQINLAGGKISGSGNDNGNLDFFDNTSITATGTTGQITADIKVRSNKALSVAVSKKDDSAEISGKIIADGKLSKSGEGNLTVSGANTYSGGTVISAGTLTTANASALGTGKVQVDGGLLKMAAALSVSAMDYISGSVENGGYNLDITDTLKVGSGATLAMVGEGTTTVQTLQLEANAKITTQGALNMSNLDMASGATITANEAVTLNGDLTLRGQINMEGNLISSLGNLTSTDQKVTLFTGVNTLTLGSDSYSSLSRNSMGQVDVSTYFSGVDSGLYSLSFSDGNVYAGLIVPEPTTATLSLLALAGLCARRRRSH